MMGGEDKRRGRELERKRGKEKERSRDEEDRC